MHPELSKLLELQAADAAVAELDARLELLRGELAALDSALAGTVAELDGVRRTVDAATRRRDELTRKLDTLRTQQERRRERLMTATNRREHAAFSAELDLAGSILGDAEAQWLRAAEEVETQSARIGELEARLAALRAEQAPEREALAARGEELDAERAAALTHRAAAAARLDRPLRIRYDRLRKSRGADAVIPIVNGACGSCFMAIPLSRRSGIEDGLLLEGCEVCGVILYAPEAAR